MQMFDIERQTAQFFIARLLTHIGDLKLRKYPGDLLGPSKWLNLCNALADTALEYLAKSEAPGINLDEQRRFLRDANELSNLVYTSLVEMDGATLDELPYAVVVPMQRWVDELQLKNATFFRAIPKAIYEVRRFDHVTYSRIRDPSSSLSDALSSPQEWPILRITVPAKALSLLPHFAIVAHEIGHIVFDNLSPNLSPDQKDITRYFNLVKSATGKQSISPQGMLLIQQTFNNWIVELFADAVGVCMLGPAFFFALCAFIEGLGPAYALSQSHPPTVLRRKIAFQKLHRGADFDFPPVFKKHTNEDLTEEINSALLDPPKDPAQMIAFLQTRNVPLESAAILVHLPTLVETLANAIYDAVENHILNVNPGLLYKSAQFDVDLENHLVPLTYAVPPIETGASIGQRKPTDFPTILNVGWVMLLTKLDKLAVRQDNPKLPFAEKAEKLHALLIKAVELSEAQRLWSSL